MSDFWRQTDRQTDRQTHVWKKCRDEEIFSDKIILTSLFDTSRTDEQARMRIPRTLLTHDRQTDRRTDGRSSPRKLKNSLQIFPSQTCFLNFPWQWAGSEFLLCLLKNTLHKTGAGFLSPVKRKYQEFRGLSKRPVSSSTYVCLSVCLSVCYVWAATMVLFIRSHFSGRGWSFLLQKKQHFLYQCSKTSLAKWMFCCCQSVSESFSGCFMA